MDSLLEDFLAASGADTDSRLEDLLVNQASPRIRKVILRKLGPGCPDIDDVCAEVLVEAAEQLRAWKAAGVDRPVENFSGYVATCSFNAASEYLRRKYPRWRRLRDRIHYVLRRDARLAVWESANGWLCGLIQWTSQDAPAPLPPLDQCDHARGMSPADSLHAVMAAAGAAVELDALVDFAAQLWCEVLDRSSVELVQQFAPPGFDEEIDQKRYAQRLWREILELPERQRQALLLNMKSDGLDVFLLFSVASFRTLAEAVALDAAEFATLWKSLPLDDLTIASRLQATRQQVINLRKSARKRLANRMPSNIEGRFASLRKG